MNLELSDDQVALRDGIRAVLEGRFGMARVRRGFDRSVWDDLAGAGVLSLLTDGFGPADAVVVLEALGEALVPGPVVDGMLAHAVHPGEIVAVAARPKPYEPLVVELYDDVDAVLVHDEAGVWRVDVATIEHDPSPWPLDPLTPVSHVALLPEGDAIAGPEVAAQWRQHGAVYTAAFLVGMAQRLTDLSVAYATEREQFGRPIGGFQAMKHLLADMVVRTEVARAAVYAAGAHLGEPGEPGLDRAVAVAKVMAGEAAVANGKTATQVHGGMGFTWEVDVHLYLKRAWVLDTRFGSVDEHCDAVYASAMSTADAGGTVSSTAPAAAL
jgi:alkylation response protein AidB-like acyl-CoA dehydrogenase